VNGPPLRRSCRGLLIDSFGRILLLQHRISGGGTVWVGPGGGIEAGEDLRQALRRELFEETGLRLTAADAAQLVWVQTAALPEMREHGYGGVTNFYFLIRVDAFEPASGVAANAPGHPDAEGILDQRWWSLTDITAAHRRGVLFAPRALPTLLRSILTSGPPSTPITIGL
jgi:8-oxo-dGTP pyrophosphatase MutT (NUDIX family)